jgi:hypothetical protein
MMFDRDFFRDSFVRRVREFASKRSVDAVKVVVVIRDGTRFDVKEIISADDGAGLMTVDGTTVFLAYGDISRVEVSEAEAASEIGFQLPSES